MSEQSLTDVYIVQQVVTKYCVHNTVAWKTSNITFALSWRSG